jgi:hypothetical protein
MDVGGIFSDKAINAIGSVTSKANAGAIMVQHRCGPSDYNVQCAD